MPHYEMPTIDKEGYRRWLYPIVSKGKWWWRRRVLAYFLIAFLLIVPWTKVGGEQTIFMDLANQKIHFFGLTFFINETIIFTGFLFFVFSSILLLTAVFGRVFCGWACPQTVFLEFVFRPIEQLIEGAGLQQKRYNKQPLSKILPFKVLKFTIYAVISFILANTLVTYFSGREQVLQYMQQSPLDHMIPFSFMMILFVIIFFQFSWFREQICTFICPYGRLQSLLLDKHSTIVAYDEKRGEPRGKPSVPNVGDCVDCGMCVQVCPTGIDIRHGLQLECVQCTQCMDACDKVMAKLGREPGLIDYRTQVGLEGGKWRILRPRLAIYSALFCLGTGLMVFFGSDRNVVEAVPHREASESLFIIDGQMIVNPIRIHLRNKTGGAVEMKATALKPEGLEIVVPQGEITLSERQKQTIHLLLRVPEESISEGSVLAEFELETHQLETGEIHRETHQVEVFGPER